MKVLTAGRLYRIRLYRYMMNKLQHNSMLQIHWVAVSLLVSYDFVECRDKRWSIIYMTIFTPTVELHLHFRTSYIPRFSHLSVCNSLFEQAAHTFMARRTIVVSASSLQQ